MRNASDYQRPIIIVVKTGTLGRYIAIAYLDWLELVTTSSSVKPSLYLPMALITEWVIFMTSRLVMFGNCFSSDTVETGQRESNPGY